MFVTLSSGLVVTFCRYIYGVIYRALSFCLDSKPTGPVHTLICYETIALIKVRFFQHCKFLHFTSYYLTITWFKFMLYTTFKVTLFSTEEKSVTTNHLVSPIMWRNSESQNMSSGDFIIILRAHLMVGFISTDLMYFG